MPYEIKRLTTAEDFARCAAMMMSVNPWDKLYFTTEQCETDLADTLLAVYGAVSGDGTIMGFCASMEHGIGFEPMIEYLCVGEDFRSQGIGTALIAHFEEALFPDADNYYLFVSDINPAAIRLYIRLGYLQIGALTNFNLESQTEFLHRKARRPRQEAARLASIRHSPDTN